ncbi:hypothetical protein G3578_16760 [Brevibacillus sp. SYP-B805]|uniref:hypothetical protein n=1 Tax=Brevibacillus sp. SYP-B805 TaxID=1578199 RepID=UPI0013EB4DDE|nr:hypothetical protein [Brevibacillus sp. SYP-B805]NGQ96818.1 hypothetical protein [Brevibacillus sp. SYP-B805]
MIRKWGMLFLALMLLLTGCSGEAALVKDAVIASLNNPNYDYEGSFQLTGEPDKLLTLVGAEKDENLSTVLNALKAGVVLQGSQQSLEQARLLLELKDAKLLRDKGLLPANQRDDVELELLINDGEVYVKTPQDSKYLQLKNDMSALAGKGNLSPEALKALQKKMNELTFSFLQKYLTTFAYKLEQAKNLGNVTVNLPNGGSVETTHIAVTLDAKELAQLALYILRDAPANPAVKDYAVDMLILFRTIAQESDPNGTKATPDQIRAQAEATVNLGLQSLKKWLETEGKAYTPEKLVDMMKAEGIQSLTWTIDWYIDANKLPVRKTSKFSVTLADKHDPAAQPFTVGFAADQVMWNYGKATSFPLPGADQTVSLQELQADPAKLKSFGENGFLRPLIEFALHQQKMSQPMGITP